LLGEGTRGSQQFQGGGVLILCRQWQPCSSHLAAILTFRVTTHRQAARRQKDPSGFWRLRDGTVLEGGCLIQEDSMDALKLLKQQHDEVEELLESLEKARKAERKRALFEELADKLAAHATMEEKLFYPRVKASKTEDLVLESAEEHLAVKRVLADMLALDVEDEHFDAKLSVLTEEVRHHARDEEEKKLFPLVRKQLSKQDLAELGDEMEQAFTSLLQQSPRNNVPNETEVAAQV
jgi:hemerythrin superfamily protein